MVCLTCFEILRVQYGEWANERRDVEFPGWKDREEDNKEDTMLNQEPERMEL
jgi:hypothetical protein